MKFAFGTFSQLNPVWMCSKKDFYAHGAQLLNWEDEKFILLTEHDIKKPLAPLLTRTYVQKMLAFFHSKGFFNFRNSPSA